MTTSITHRFSAHYSERLRYNWVDILFSQTRLCNFETGWVFCHISVVFFRIPFKPKGHSYDGYSTYMQWFTL